MNITIVGTGPKKGERSIPRSAGLIEEGGEGKT